MIIGPIVYALKAAIAGILVYTGHLCEVELPCVTTHCQNNGTCVAVGLEFRCDCEEDFTGNLCENELPCASMPCYNGATCQNSEDFSSYSCICGENFTGARCDTLVHDATQTVGRLAAEGLGIAFGAGSRSKFNGQVHRT